MMDSKDWGERRGLNPRPSVPQTDALPAELRSPQTKYTQSRPHSVFSKVGLKDGSGSGCFVGQPLLAVRLRPAEIERGSQEWLSYQINSPGPRVTIELYT